VRECPAPTPAIFEDESGGGGPLPINPCGLSPRLSSWESNDGVVIPVSCVSALPVPLTPKLDHDGMERDDAELVLGNPIVC